MWLLHKGELVHAAKGGPLGDDQVAVFVDRAAVGGVRYAFSPFFRLEAVIGALLLVRIVTYLGHDGARFIEDSDAALELWDECKIAADVDGRGHAQIRLDHLHEIPVEVPVLDAVIVAIADKEE